MARFAIAATAILLSGCSVLDNVEIFRNSHDAGWLAAGEHRIDCNPQPELIYSKTGDLIETVYPILHPLCDQYLGEEIIVSSSAPSFDAAAKAEADKKAASRDRRDRRERAARRKAEAASKSSSSGKSSAKTSSGSRSNASSDGNSGTGSNANSTSSSGSKPGNTSANRSGCGSKPCRS